MDSLYRETNYNNLDKTSLFEHTFSRKVKPRTLIVYFYLTHCLPQENLPMRTVLIALHTA